jgi:hypothetical protein
LGAQENHRRKVPAQGAREGTRMKIVRIMAGVSLAAGLFAGSPASAQFFL